MKNPFPGMNPWLEARWHTVHARLLTYAGDMLQARLPDGLFAVTEETLRIDNGSQDQRRLRPDLQVTQDWDRPVATVTRASAEPANKAHSFIVLCEPDVERWIEIIDQSGQLITAIELLSPSNKDGRGSKELAEKRKTFLGGRANYVEIDLLREGERSPYYCVIIRAGEIQKREVIPMPLEAPLPSIPIPLREDDTDVYLDLQELMTLNFERARFPWINYRQPPDPPLTESQRLWAERILREAGLA